MCFCSSGLHFPSNTTITTKKRNFIWYLCFIDFKHSVTNEIVNEDWCRTSRLFSWPSVCICIWYCHSFERVHFSPFQVCCALWMFNVWITTPHCRRRARSVVFHFFFFFFCCGDFAQKCVLYLVFFLAHIERWQNKISHIISTITQTSAHTNQSTNTFCVSELDWNERK